MSVDAEKTILALPEVESCKIIYRDGELDQIYVSAKIPTQHPGERLQFIKSLVRSIVGALALEHGWNVDYRKVKIVDSLEFPAPEKPKNGEPRIRIVAAYLRYAPQPEVRVELAFRESMYTGQAPYDASDLPGAATAAFIDAFHKLNLGEVTPIFTREIPGCLAHGDLVITKLRYKYGGSSTDLLGVAESHQDLILCTVRACLDALNRRVALCWLGNSCPAEPDRIITE
ncbi:MAG TPA: hypothetical protein GXX47_06370 [Firmicutes bacterium]|nr:hypothetical protein [Bacillota bacterium]